MRRTMNIDFLKACDALNREGLFKKVHALTDWTNGGLRGDVREICNVAQVGITLYKERIEALMNRKVLELLQSLSIDYLGVSMDSLLIFCPRNVVEEVINAIKNVGVLIDEIGKVIETPKQGILLENGKPVDMSLRYRESAYTRVKQVVGDTAPPDKDVLMEKVEKAAVSAIEKSEELIQFILKERSEAESSQSS